MAETRFIYNNLWRKGTMLDASSEDPQHPATDTQVDTKSMYYKALVKTSPCTVPNDLITPQVIDFVAILGHNFEPTDVTIKFQGATNSAFTTGIVTEELTYNATDIFEFFTAWPARQYVRVLLEKATDFTDYPQFANVICGKYFEPNIDYVRGYAPGREDPSEVELTDDMVLFAQEKPILKTWRLPYWSLDDASKDEVLALMEECGKHKAFVVVFDKALPNSDSHLVRIEEASSPEFQFFNIWNWNLVIKEVK